MRRLGFLLLLATAAGAQVVVGTMSPVTRLNDQVAGINGYPNTGIFNLGDTWMFTQADNGTFYTSINDGNIAPNYSQYNLTVASLSSNFQNLATVNTLSAYGNGAQQNTNGWSDGSTWKSTCLASVHGVLYMCILRQYDNPPFNGQNESIIKSYDHGATWCNYTHSTPSGCSSTSASGDPPTNGQSLWNSSTVMRGLGIVQYCQDNSIGCPSADNNGAYTYFTSWPSDFSGFYVLRCLTTKLPDLANLASNVQAFTGGDGTLDANWSTNLAGAVKIISGMHMVGSNAYFIAGLNQYIMLVGERQELAINGVGADDTALYSAPHPWGPWTRSSVMPADQAITSCTGIIPGTQQTVSVSPLTVTVKAVCNGEYSVSGAGGISQFASGYSLDLATLTLQLSNGPIVSSVNASGHRHNGLVLPGLLQELRFHPPQTATGSQTLLMDSSGRGLNASGNTANVFMPEGLASWNGQDYYVDTGLNYTGNDFTAILAYRQWGALSAYEDILTNGANATVPLYVRRDASKADNWVVTVGSQTSSDFVLTDGSPQLIIITRSGSTVNVYSSAGIGATSATPIATLTGATGNLSGTTFWLGYAQGLNSSAGSNWFDGEINYWAFYNRALTIPEIIQDANAIEGRLARRGFYLARAINPAERPLDPQPPFRAWGVTRLLSSYSGAAMTVRRASDSGTQAIGFTTAGDLDTITLLSFCASTNCYVTRLNAQDGSGDDAVQVTAANQPMIVNAGALVTAGSTGKATLSFSGSQWLASQNAFYYGLQASAHAVVSLSAAAVSYCKVMALVNPVDGAASSFATADIIRNNNSPSNGTAISIDRNGALPNPAAGQITLGTPSAVTEVADAFNLRSYADGVAPTGQPLTAGATTNGFTPRFFVNQVLLGYDNLSNPMTGTLSVVAVWTSAPSADAIGILRSWEKSYFGLP